MHSDVISFRVLLAMPAASMRALLRQAAAQASVPAEVIEADSAAAADQLLVRGGTDLVLLDGRMPEAEKVRVCTAARAAKEQPFVIAIGKDADGVEVDGSVRKPSTSDEAQKTIDDCIRARLQTRVLIVDDSPTLRGIVRKIVSASRFPLKIADTDDGCKALREVGNGNVDIVLLDFNMPGSDGLEILSEMRRLHSHVTVVMMTSTGAANFVERAQLAGAGAFLNKPFFPVDIDAVLYRFHKIDPPRRAGVKRSVSRMAE